MMKSQECVNFFEEALGKDSQNVLEPQIWTVSGLLICLYTHCTHDSVKATIMSKFTMETSLCVVIATIAFGMGIDCPDVRQIIH